MPVPPQSTPLVPPGQPQFPRRVLITPQVCDCTNACKRATTILAREPGAAYRTLLTVNCKAWRCPPCARQKIRIMAARTALAKPNRLITLTLDPKSWSSPRDAFVQTAAQVPELIRYLRARFGDVEYLRVTEQQRNGYPHYHLLVRSKYLPQPVIKEWWFEHTKGQIVDVRQVKESFKAYNYLAKYLTKMHSLDWTERHCSTSKNFWPPQDPTKCPKREYTEISRLNEHPNLFLAEWYTGRTLTQMGPTTWLLTDDPLPKMIPVVWSEIHLQSREES